MALYNADLNVSGTLTIPSGIFSDSVTVSGASILTSDSVVGGGSALTVKEADGAPTVANVDTIVVTDGTLTDDGGGQVTISTGGSGGGGSATASGSYWLADAPPVDPSPFDDEFDTFGQEANQDSAEPIDPAVWTEWDPGATVNTRDKFGEGIGPDGFGFSTGSVPNVWGGWVRDLAPMVATVSGGGSWWVDTKVKVGERESKELWTGIAIGGDLIGSPTTEEILYIALVNNSTSPGVLNDSQGYVSTVSNGVVYNSAISTNAQSTDSSGPMPTDMYLRIGYGGPADEFYAMYSTDGSTWSILTNDGNLLASGTLNFLPQYVGLVGRAEDAGGSVHRFQYFRFRTNQDRNAAASRITIARLPLLGRRVDADQGLTGGGGVTDPLVLASGVFSESLTISGVPVSTGTGGGGASTLQEAYDGGDGTIATTGGKPLELTGTGELTAVTGTFTEGLTVGTGSTVINDHEIATTSGIFSESLTVAGVPVNVGLPLADNSFKKLFQVADIQPNGTGQLGITAGSWVTRRLNTVVNSNVEGASLASDQITLPAGTYFADWTAPGYFVGLQASRIYDTTHSTELIISTGGFDNTSTVLTNTLGAGKFTLNEESVLELQHRVSVTNGTNGLGAAVSFGSDEVYANIRIWDVGFQGVSIDDLQSVSGTFTQSLTVSGVPVLIGGPQESQFVGSNVAFIRNFTVETADSNTITISDIPQNASNLLIQFSLRASNANENTGARIRFNEDSSANYDTAQHLLANGAITLANNGYGQTEGGLGVATAANAPTGNFCTGDVLVAGYSNSSKNTTYRGSSYEDRVAITEIDKHEYMIYGGTYTVTDAITSVTILNSNSSNWAVGTKVTIYGYTDDVLAAVVSHVIAASGTFSDSLTISGVPVSTGTGGGGASTLQEAYDGGDGTISTTGGKPFELTGTGELVAVTGTFTGGLTVGNGSTVINDHEITTATGSFTEVTITGTAKFGQDNTPTASGSVVLFASQDTEQTTTSTSFVDANCETAALDNGVEYLIIYNGNAGNSDEIDRNDFKISFGGTKFAGTEFPKSSLGTFGNNHFNASVLSGVFRVTGDGTSTVKFEFLAATSETSYAGAMSITCIPLDRFTENTDYYYAENANSDSNTITGAAVQDPPNVVLLNSTLSSLAAGDWLFIWSAEIDAGAGPGRSALVRFQVDGNTIGASRYSWEGNNNDSPDHRSVTAANIVNVPSGGDIQSEILVSSSFFGGCNFRRGRLFAINTSLFSQIISTTDSTGFTSSDANYLDFSGLNTTIVPTNVNVPTIILTSAAIYIENADTAATTAIRNETDEIDYRLDSGGRDMSVGGTGGVNVNINPSFMSHYEEISVTSEYRFQLKSTGGGLSVVGRDEDDNAELSEMIVWEFLDSGTAFVPITQTCIDDDEIQTGTILADTGTFRTGLTVSGVSVNTGDVAIPDPFTTATGIFNDSLTISGVPVATGTGVSDHSLLSNLDFASAGHTGFGAAADVTTNATDIAALTTSGVAQDAELLTVSGGLQTQIDASSSTLQEAYDSGDGTISTTGGKPFELTGTGELVAVTGTFTDGLTVGGASTFIDGGSITTATGTFTEVTVTGTAKFGVDDTPEAGGASVVFASQDTEQTTTSTSFVDAACETVALDNGVSYLVIYAGNVGSNSTNTTQLRVLFGSTKIAGCGMAKSALGTFGDAHYNSSYLHGVYKVTGDGIDTVKFELKADTSTTAYAGAMSIICVPLDQYDENTDWFYAETANGDGFTAVDVSTTDPPSVTLLSSTFTSMAAGDWLFFWASEGDAVGGPTLGATTRFQVAGATIGTSRYTWQGRSTGSFRINGASAANVVNVAGGNTTVEILVGSTGASISDHRRGRIFAINTAAFTQVLSSVDTTGQATSSSAYVDFTPLNTSITPSQPNAPVIVLTTAPSYLQENNSGFVSSIRNETDGIDYRDEAGGREAEQGGIGALYVNLANSFMAHFEERTGVTEYRYQFKSVGTGPVAVGRNEDDDGGEHSEMIVWEFLPSEAPFVPITQTCIDDDEIQTGTLIADTGTFRTGLTVSGVSVSTGAVVVPDPFTSVSGIFEQSLTVSGVPVNIGSGGLQNVVEDTSPQLGGNLDAQSNDITAVNEITAVTGTFTGGVTIGGASTFIDGGSITTTTGIVTEIAVTELAVSGTARFGTDDTVTSGTNIIFASQDTEQLVTSSPQDVNCETTALENGVEYLVIYAGNAGGEFTTQTAGLNILFGATKYGICNSRRGSLGTFGANHFNAAATNGIFKVTGDGSSTVKFQGTRSGIATTYVGAMSIICVPLDRFAQNTDYYYAETTNSDSFILTDIAISDPPTSSLLSSTFTSMAAGDWLFLWADEGAAAVFQTDAYATRFQVDGNTIGPARWGRRNDISTASCQLTWAGANVVNIPSGGNITCEILCGSLESAESNWRRGRIFAINTSLFTQVLNTTDSTGLATTATSFQDFTALTTSITPSNVDSPIIVFTSATSYTEDANSGFTSAIRNETTATNYRIDSGDRNEGVGGGGASTIDLNNSFMAHFEERSSPTEYRYQFRSEGGGEVSVGRNDDDTGGELAEMIVWEFALADAPFVPITHTVIADLDISTGALISDQIDARVGLTVSGVPVATGTGGGGLDTAADETITGAWEFSNSLTVSGVPVVIGPISAAHVTVATGITLANNVSVDIAWDTTILDEGGWFDSGSNDKALVVPAGVEYVHIVGSVEFTLIDWNTATAADSALVQTRILINGGEVASAQLLPVEVSSTQLNVSSPAAVAVTAGDIITLSSRYSENFGAGTIEINPFDNARTFLSVRKV